jgi:glycerol uptake facilitator-like aquaporin
MMGTSKTQAVFIEMFGTAAVVFSVLVFCTDKYHVSAFAPVRNRFVTQDSILTVNMREHVRSE